MATLADKDRLIEILAEAPDGMELGQLSSRLGKGSPITSTLLSRLSQEGMVVSPERGVWRLTEAGVAKTVKQPAAAVVTPPEPGSVMKSGEATEIAAPESVPGAYEKFMQICRSCGIKEDFLKSMSDHVFTGNVYDLTYVWETLEGMYLRPDVTKRIFNFWSRVINQPIPTELVPHVMPTKTEAAKEAETKLPTRFTLIGDEIVPDPEGEFSFAQARQVLMTRAVQGAAPNMGAEKVSEIIGAITPFLETQRAARVDEIEKQGEQSVLATVLKAFIENKGGSGQQPVTLTDMMSIVDKIEEARKTATAAVLATGAKPATGFEDLERMVNMWDKMKSIFGGRNEGSGVTIAIRGENGETGAVPLDTYFKLEDHKRKTKQEDAEFESKQETGKVVRKFFESISKAASNLGTRK